MVEFFLTDGAGRIDEVECPLKIVKIPCSLKVMPLDDLPSIVQLSQQWFSFDIAQRRDSPLTRNAFLFVECQ